MGVRRVNSGEPITAFWANSIVNALDTVGGNRTTTASGVSSNAPQQFNNPAAFQIQMTQSGCWTIEAGTIFINGELIKGIGNTYGNHATSLQNWESVYFHKGTNLPKWKIKGYIPKTAQGVIANSKFWLLNENAEDTQQQQQQLPQELPEGYTWWEQYINDVDDTQGTIKQLVTGTIHITLPVAVATLRPFDITITGTTKAVPDEGQDPQPQADGDQEQETEQDEEENEIVEFEICSGTILLPNKERLLIPQRLQMSYSTVNPFYVVLTVKRDEQGTCKYKYTIQTEEALTQDGWTLTEAVPDEEETT